MTKYFSAFMRPTYCIKTHKALPPSSAGIGSILKIASANEIIPAKARYIRTPLALKIVSPTLIIPSGHDRPSTDLLIFSLLNDKRFDHNLPNIRKVSLICVHISYQPATKACHHEKVIGTISAPLSREIATPSTHSSSGHVIDSIFVFHDGSLISKGNVFPNCFPKISVRL